MAMASFSTMLINNSYFVRETWYDNLAKWVVQQQQQQQQGNKK